MSLAAQSYIGSLAATGDHKTFLKHGKVGHLFRSEADAALFKFVDTHVRAHQKFPDISTLLTHAKVALPPTVEPADYYLDLLRRSYVEVAIRETTGRTSSACLVASPSIPVTATKSITWPL